MILIQIALEDGGGLENSSHKNNIVSIGNMGQHSHKNEM